MKDDDKWTPEWYADGLELWRWCFYAAVFVLGCIVVAALVL